ncbi:MAG: hypothetical protein QW579_05735 [Desulfurococcaceae archaeon]
MYRSLSCHGDFEDVLACAKGEHRGEDCNGDSGPCKRCQEALKHLKEAHRVASTCRAKVELAKRLMQRLSGKTIFFCHYFYSPLIANYFALLGVHPGVLYSQTQNYQEAHRIAGEFVKNYYKTYPYARRLHYLLKEKGLVFYEDDEENGEHVLVLEIHYYSNGEVGLRVKDNKGEEVLFEENIKPEPPLRIEIRTAFHREHIYEPNEETYFHRTNIL